MSTEELKTQVKTYFINLLDTEEYITVLNLNKTYLTALWSTFSKSHYNLDDISMTNPNMILFLNDSTQVNNAYVLTLMIEKLSDTLDNKITSLETIDNTFESFILENIINKDDYISTLLTNLTTI